MYSLKTLHFDDWILMAQSHDFFGLKLRPRKWMDLPSVSNLKWYTPFFNFGFFEDCWYINKWIRCSLWEINGFAQKSLSFHGFQQSLIESCNAYLAWNPSLSRFSIFRNNDFQNFTMLHLYALHNCVIFPYFSGRSMSDTVNLFQSKVSSFTWYKSSWTFTINTDINNTNTTSPPTEGFQ